MAKLFKLFIILMVMIFVQTPLVNAEMEYQEQLIRVGLSTRNFNALEYPSVRISASGSFAVTDLGREKTILNASAGDIITVAVNSCGFSVAKNGKYIYSKLSGPIGLHPNSGLLRLVDSRRKGSVPEYRGRFEIVRAPDKDNKLSVVNVLHLDDYLKGVVPNELPPSFGFEALKAQAVAARNYAIRPREKYYSQFDICDSVMCQVYFGYKTEHPLANKAIEETSGLVALYNGDVITALYSSAPGGFSESYENVFSDPKSKQFPADPLPYLKGKPDLVKMKDLSSESAARSFYTRYHPSYDAKSSYYRWSKNWTASELQNVLNRTLKELSANSSSNSFVSPAFKSNSSIGVLKDIRVLQRGISGKAMDLKIQGSNGSWIVKKELNIRRLLKKSGKALPSANIVFTLKRDNIGNLCSITVHGGGFGHGVGMSQYGASYMSKNGKKFDEILKHYYSDVAIGTEPVIMVADIENTQIPIKEDFYSPNGGAVLWLKNEGVQKVLLNINGKDLLIESDSKTESFKVINIDDYVQRGKNQVIFYPPQPTTDYGLSVTMWIEVVKAH